jgi:hypothetical protein
MIYVTHILTMRNKVSDFIFFIAALPIATNTPQTICDSVVL